MKWLLKQIREAVHAYCTEFVNGMMIGAFLFIAGMACGLKLGEVWAAAITAACSGLK